MAAALVFYTNPRTRGRIVRWMLEEVGQPYRTEVLDFGPAMKTPAYRAINPMGKVPALKHGDMVVTETAAICAYLADAFPQAGLAPPPTDPLRGAYYRWLFFAAGPLEQAAVNEMLHVTVPPEHKGMVGYGSLRRVLAVLEQAVTGQDFLVGGRFSAADVYAGSHIMWGLKTGSLPPRPDFVRYAAGLAARPAAQRAAALDDASFQTVG
jgi:glutathione S-transferase